MPTAKQFVFTYKEIAEMMVREVGVTEGHWGIFMRFGIQGANVGPGPDDIVPAAIVPIMELGLQRFDEPTNLTVDAGEVTQKPDSKRLGREAVAEAVSVPKL
jgi:hypothetical protein